MLKFGSAPFAVYFNKDPNYEHTLHTNIYKNEKVGTKFLLREICLISYYIKNLLFTKEVEFIISSS